MYRRDSISIIQENLRDLWEDDLGVRKSTENEFFGIVWRITNFTMCKLQKKEYLESPIFVAESLENTNWYLRLYPKGEEHNDDIVCCLFRGNSSPDSITIRYQLSIGVSHECVDQIQTFQKYSRSAVSASARQDDILDEVRKYPLVDILLVDCRIWNCQRRESISDVKSLVSYLHQADNLPQEVLHSTMDEIETLKRKLRPYPESCSVYTRIPVERWYFLWSIKKFSHRQPNETETITVVSVSENAPKILMTFFVNEDGILETNIRELTEKYETSFTVNFRIQLVGTHERNIEILQDMHLFSSNEIWKIPLHVSQIEIVLQEDRFLLDDKVTFRCELAISYENAVSNIDSCSYVSNESKLNHERKISYDCSIYRSNYAPSAWTPTELIFVICVISFFIVFIFEVLMQILW